MNVVRITATVAVVAGTALAALIAGAGAQSQATCSRSNPVEVGTVYSLSGPSASIGRLAQQGASMAIKDINASGGLLGRCIKQALKDDGGDPTKAAQVVRELVDQDKVPLIVGPVLSTPTRIALPVMNQAKIININESAFAASGDASQYPYTFRNEVNTDQQAQNMLPILKTYKWSKVAILAVNNAFGTSFVQSLNQALPPAGFQIVKSVFVNSGTPDMTPQITELKQTNPDVLIVALVGDPDQVAALKARLQLGWNIQVLGLSTMSNPATVANFTKGQMARVYTSQVFKALTYASEKAGQGKPTSPAAARFVTEFAKWIKAHNIKQSISQATGGYDAFMLLAKAVNGAKSLDADTLKQYFETHSISGVRGRFVWSKDRHDGTTLGMFGLAVSNSLNNYGLLRAAPVQK